MPTSSTANGPWSLSPSALGARPLPARTQCDFPSLLEIGVFDVREGGAGARCVRTAGQLRRQRRAERREPHGDANINTCGLMRLVGPVAVGPGAAWPGVTATRSTHTALQVQVQQLCPTGAGFRRGPAKPPWLHFTDSLPLSAGDRSRWLVAASGVWTGTCPLRSLAARPKPRTSMDGECFLVWPRCPLCTYYVRCSNCVPVSLPCELATRWM